MGDSAQDVPITDPVGIQDGLPSPSPQEEIANLLRVIEMNKDALAEMQEEVRTFRDLLEEQEKLTSALTTERDALAEKVQQLEADLDTAVQKVTAHESAPPATVPPAIRVNVAKVENGDYPPLIPTPSGNHATVVVDDEQLENMKNEMLEQMRELNREELSRMIARQEELRWNSGNKSRSEQKIEETTTIVVDQLIPESNSRPEVPVSHTRPEVSLTHARPEMDLASAEAARSPPSNKGLLLPESAETPATEDSRRKKNLFRSGSFKNWSSEMLEGLKDEMMESLREMRRSEMSKMLAGQDKLRWGDAAKKETSEDNTGNTLSVSDDSRIRGKNLLRNGSKADWSDVDLDALKTEMYVELTRIHKKELADMISQQDAIRYPQDDEITRTRSSSNRSDMLSSLTDVEMTALRDDIVKEIASMTKKELSSMFEKQMQLRWQQTSEATTPNPNTLSHPSAALGSNFPRDGKNNLFRQASQERWDMDGLQKMETEISSEIHGMQRKELQRVFDKSEQLYWQGGTENDQSGASVPTVSSVQSTGIQTTSAGRNDEPKLLFAEDAKDTPGGPDELHALNYVSPVTTEIYSEMKQRDPPVATEMKDRGNADEDDLIPSDKPTPGLGATIVDVPDEHVTRGGPDEDAPEAPMSSQEPKVIIQVVPLQDHPDFGEYRLQSDNAIRGYKQEIAALISKHERETKQFQDSKMQLILSTSKEMDLLRDMIRQMADNFRIVQAQVSLRQ